MIPTRRSAIYVWCLMFDEVCRGHLESDEAELLGLTDSTLCKLSGITDEQFAELELVPDFDTDE